MGISILIFSFIIIFLSFLFSYKEKEAVFTNLRLAFVKSTLVISLFVVIFTEGLSFFRILTSSYIMSLWSAVFIASLSYFIYAVKKNSYSLKDLRFHRVVDLFKNRELTVRILVALMLIVILSLSCVAFTMNSNWDSYTYHLPRVEHWIQDKNVDFFPTNNIRQLYLSPFAEYSILNIKLLSNNDLFVNFVQFISLINCILLASLIAKCFGLSRKGQLLASILALTIPMGILQATTTQTDLVVSFFIVSFVYFGISLVKKKNLSGNGLLFMCISFALGILTKSTFYIFAFPFCLMLGLYYLRYFKLRSSYILLILILSFILLNGPFLMRNYQQFGSPLGPQKTAPYYEPSLNDDFGIKETLSNGVKDIGLHLALPNDHWNNEVDKMVVEFHKIIGFPLDSPATSWFNIEYKTAFYLTSDNVGNFFQLILFFMGLLIVLVRFRSTDKFVIIYSFSIVFGYFIFAFLLKWQPWQTRLDLPAFFLVAPFVAYALLSVKWKVIAVITPIFLLVISIAALFVYNPLKPILGKDSILWKDNSSYIFGYDVAMKIESELKKDDISSIGLVLGGDSWEWQYWLLSKNTRFEYVYFSKDLTSTPNFDPDFRYKALIIDDIYLSDPQVMKLMDDKSSILGISNVDNKVTLVIYKTEQSRLLTY